MKLYIRRRSERVLASLRHYLLGLFRKLNDDQVFLWAGAIAFRVLVSFLPLIILITGIFGLVMRQDDPFFALSGFIQSFLPAYESEQVLQFMAALQQASGTITLIGVAGLFISIVLLFSTLRVVVSNVFRDFHQPRSMIRAYGFDARMVLQVGFLFLLSFGFTLLLNIISQAGLQMIDALPGSGIWITRGWRTLFYWLSYLIPLVITMAMFFQIYYFVPNPRPLLSSALSGAFVAGIFWELAKFTFTLYATYVGFQRTVPAEGNGSIAPLTEVFGLIIALVFWVYFSAFVFIAGAIIAAVHEKRHWRLHPKRQKQARRDVAPAEKPASHIQKSRQHG